MSDYEEVWLRAWCAVTRAGRLASPDSSTIWADKCLEDFLKKFRQTPDGSPILTPVRDSEDEQ